MPRLAKKVNENTLIYDEATKQIMRMQLEFHNRSEKRKFEDLSALNKLKDDLQPLFLKIRREKNKGRFS
jgi:hypothetical protein